MRPVAAINARRCGMLASRLLGANAGSWLQCKAAATSGRRGLAPALKAAAVREFEWHALTSGIAASQPVIECIANGKPRANQLLARPHTALLAYTVNASTCNQFAEEVGTVAGASTRPELPKNFELGAEERLYKWWVGAP